MLNNIRVLVGSILLLPHFIAFSVCSLTGRGGVKYRKTYSVGNP